MQVNDQNYVDMAEKVIIRLKNKKDRKGTEHPNGNHIKTTQSSDHDSRHTQ